MTRRLLADTGLRLEGVTHVALTRDPKMGKLSLAQAEHEHDPEFIRLRHQRAAVESAINALEDHALSRCLDHGIAGS